MSGRRTAGRETTWTYCNSTSTKHGWNIIIRLQLKELVKRVVHLQGSAICNAFLTEGTMFGVRGLYSLPIRMQGQHEIYHVRAELTMHSIQKTSVLKRFSRTRSSIIYIENQVNTAALRNAFIGVNPTYRLQSIFRLRRTFSRVTKYCTEEREHENNK
jgi:hypothetical protein